MKTIVLTFLALVALGARLNASLILTDPFSYPDGAVVGAPGSPWVNHSGTAGTALVHQKRLEVFASRAEDINAPLPGGPYQPASGAFLFASCKLTCTNLPSRAGTYFAHFKDASSTGFRARLWASTTNAPAGSFKLSIANGAGQAPSTFPLNLSLNTEYLVVIRYEVQTTASTLWINPAGETDPGATATDFGASPLSIISYAFRQASGGGSMLIDSLKVGLAFNDVAGPNSPPTLSPIPDQQLPSGTASSPIPFVVEDAETPASNLFVAGTSSNQSLVPNDNLIFQGTGSDRSLIVTPRAGLEGEAVITLVVSDADGNVSNTSFRLVVGAPGISDIPDQLTPANSTIGPIAFTVSDHETTPASLTVAAHSSNTALLPDDRVAVTGTGADRTLTLRPLPNQAGLTTVSVSVSDGTLSAKNSFVLTVSPELGVVRADNFDRPDGPAVDGSGLWVRHSGTEGETILFGHQLKLSEGKSEDIGTTLAGGPFSLTSGAVLYASFTVLCTDLPTGVGGFFAHFKDDGAGNFRGRLFAGTANAAPGSFRLGIANAASTVGAGAQFARDLQTNRAYHAVIRYNVGLGLSTLWVDPTSESEPGVAALDVPAPVPISMFAFRQVSGIGALCVDTLRIGGAFQDVATTSHEEIALHISHTAAELRLSWPATPSGFVLQRATRLWPAQWSNHPGLPATEGNQQVVLIPTGDDYQFFRLLKVN